MIKITFSWQYFFFRLPALTSIPTTLDLALTGKTVKADKAKKLGIVDLLVSPLGPGKKISYMSCHLSQQLTIQVKTN